MATLEVFAVPAAVWVSDAGDAALVALFALQQVYLAHLRVRGHIETLEALRDLHRPHWFRHGGLDHLHQRGLGLQIGHLLLLALEAGRA